MKCLFAETPCRHHPEVTATRWSQGYQFGYLALEPIAARNRGGWRARRRRLTSIFVFGIAIAHCDELARLRVEPPTKGGSVVMPQHVSIPEISDHEYAYFPRFEVILARPIDSCII
jgi:hypothetical protein